jgi:hypothetical protein
MHFADIAVSLAGRRRAVDTLARRSHSKSTKPEIRNKSKAPNAKALRAEHHLGGRGYEFPFSVLGICFGFRVSDFSPEGEQIAGQIPRGATAGRGFTGRGAVSGIPLRGVA